MLQGAGWYLVTDVSGQHIGPSSRVKQPSWTDRPLEIGLICFSEMLLLNVTDM
jgi:hypothetical protein